MGHVLGNENRFTFPMKLVNGAAMVNVTAQSPLGIGGQTGISLGVLTAMRKMTKERYMEILGELEEYQEDLHIRHRRGEGWNEDLFFVCAHVSTAIAELGLVKDYV
jgi:hypothetical protein